jgi:hypothetical protein
MIVQDQPCRYRRLILTPPFTLSVVWYWDLHLLAHRHGPLSRRGDAGERSRWICAGRVNEEELLAHAREVAD